MRVRSLLTTLFQRSSILTAVQLSFLILFLTIFIYFLIQNKAHLSFSRILGEWWISLILLLLALLFLLFKSRLLFLSGTTFGINRPYLHFVRVFSVSAFLELVTLSGKIGSDGFKFWLWNEIPMKERLYLLSQIRLIDTLVFFLFLLAVAFPKVTMILLFLVIVVLFWFRAKTVIPIRHHALDLKLIFRMMIFSALSYGIIITQQSLVFSSLGLTINGKVIFFFLLAHGLGALSQLPFGLGVKDFSLLYLLKGSLSEVAIVEGLVWLRLCGEFFVSILGAIILQVYFRKKKRLLTGEQKKR